MSRERWNRLKQLFGLALELPEPVRESWLRARTADDPELLAEVLDLLDQDRDREDTFLRGRPWSWVAAQSG